MDWILFLIIGGIVLAVAICLCLAIANFAPERFLDIFKEINAERVENLAPLDFLNSVNQEQFAGNLQTFQIDRLAGDAYMRGGKLFLSKSTLYDRGIASFATLAHELGHALQDREGSKLKTKRILQILNDIFGIFLFPSLIAGMILAALGNNLFWYGIGLLVFAAMIFVFTLTLKLFTISIEKDASKKAINLLEKYANFDKKEQKLAKKLLSSAKLTYWGSFFASLLGWTFLIKKRYR